MSNAFLIYQNDSNYKLYKYKDYAGRLYSYDNFVPRYKELKPNDICVIRLNKNMPGIIGWAKIDFIDQIPNKIKQRFRCPLCKSLNLNRRKTLSP